MTAKNQSVARLKPRNMGSISKAKRKERKDEVTESLWRIPYLAASLFKVYIQRMLARFVEIRFPHLWMPVALYATLGAFLVALSLSVHPRSLAEILALFSIGVISWTLIEYALHRFAFHGLNPNHPLGRIASAFHLSHHEAVAAKEPDIVITRPAGSLPFALLFYFVFALLSLSFSKAALLEAGAFFGYLLYEGVHYGAHHFQAHNRLTRYWKNYHLQHHFRHPKGCFGVTSPVWDWVFRTKFNG